MKIKFSKVIVLGLVVGLVLSANIVIAQVVTPNYIVNPIKDFVMGVIIKNEKPIDVNVANQPIDIKGSVDVNNCCEDKETTTKVLGSNRVYVDAGDLVLIPSGGKVLYGSYDGSGRMTYLFARGNGERFGVEIEVDGQMVAKTDVHHTNGIIKNSNIWRVADPNGMFEVIQKFPFRESLKIYLYNNEASDSTGGAHIEIETTD